MQKKKVLATAVAAGLLFTSNHVLAASGLEADAKGPVAVQNGQQEDSSNFIKFSGTITEIAHQGNSIALTVEENSLKMIFPIADDVLLLNNGNGENYSKDKLAKGQKVDVYYDRYKIMPMIYPATIEPNVVIVKEQETGEVKVAKFDNNFVSLDNELKLNLTDETALLNQKGDPITKDKLMGKELVVFYTISTKSLPARTTPTKVIALEKTKYQISNEIAQIISEDHIVKNGAKMIPLRKVAEHLGYEVKWLPKTNGVQLRKENSSIDITIGKKEYGYNKSLRNFKEKPLSKDNKTYVSEELLEVIMQK